MNEYDALIIGAGQAGIPLARRLAKEGWRVAIAERRHLGGSCVNFGCTPTKAVVASARVAHLARRAMEYGVRIPNVEIDFPAVLRRAKKMVAESVKGLAAGLNDSGAGVLLGHARFDGRAGDLFRVSVGDDVVLARHVILDTGSRTALPPIEGLADVDFIHAGNWLEHETLPQSVLIVGAGYIGLEMAQFYRRMGSEVAVVDPGNQVAAHEDVDVSAALQKLLEDEGVVFHHGTRANRIRRDGQSIRLTVDWNGQSKELVASHLFIATGRRPNTDDLGLETIGLSPEDNGIIKVDQALSTPVAGVWACGDIRGGPMFTHSAWDDHRILEAQLLEDGRHTTKGRIVPYAIFTDPELGRVGLTEKEARQKHGDAIRVARFDMRHNGKANEIGETAGFIKLIADGKTDELLGAAVLSAEGAELVAAYITLMNSGARLAAICRAIYIHPTLAEALQSAVSELDLGLKQTAD